MDKGVCCDLGEDCFFVVLGFRFKFVVSLNEFICILGKDCFV